MDIVKEINWPKSLPPAAVEQKLASEQIRFTPNTPEPVTVAAVDTAYGFDGRMIYASAAAMTWPDLEPVEYVRRHLPAVFPHTPSLLFYREGPVMLEALSQLNCEPDLIIVNGHGMAHPESCGMAGQVGLAFGRPTIGCARRLLVGRYLPLDEAKGANQFIRYQGKNVGIAFRSKANVKPVFISPGYLCDLTYAKEMVLSMLRGYRQPEPLRMAHLYANKYKRKLEKARKKSQPIN